MFVAMTKDKHVNLWLKANVFISRSKHVYSKYMYTCMYRYMYMISGHTASQCFTWMMTYYVVVLTNTLLSCSAVPYTLPLRQPCFEQTWLPLVMNMFISSDERVRLLQQTPPSQVKTLVTVVFISSNKHVPLQQWMHFTSGSECICLQWQMRSKCIIIILCLWLILHYRM